MSVSPLPYGQQFILQAPQPQQARPFSPVFPGAVPGMPVLPASAPAVDILDKQFEKQNQALSQAILDEKVEKPYDAPDEKSPELDEVMPQEKQDKAAVSDDAEPGILSTEETMVSVDGPIVLNLKSTTKDDLTIMAGQDLANLFKAAGPELLAAMNAKKGKHHGPDKKEKEDVTKPTIDDTVTNASDSTAMVAPKMGSFNTLG